MIMMMMMIDGGGDDDYDVMEQNDIFAPSKEPMFQDNGFRTVLGQLSDSFRTVLGQFQDSFQDSLSPT